MTKMIQDEKEAYLSEVRIGVLAINDAGSGPLTAPLWYDYRPGGEIFMIVAADSRKGKLLAVGQRVGLVAQSEALPYSYVSVEGPVTSVSPVTFDELLSMAYRYLGEKQGRQYAQAAGIEKEIGVRVRPERWLAVDYAKS
jgi:hypothetical protein